jgi:ubiquinone biosynthesis protein UbiJ
MIHFGTVIGLNHVLRQQDWPRARLRPFAGRTVAFRLAPFPDLCVSIRDDGLLDEARADSEADLTVTLKPSELPRLLRRDENALSDIAFAGAADLAQVVRQLFRELEWDVEEDLSRIFGDALAHRMAQTGRDLVSWQQEAATRLAQNFADYWTEERPLIIRREQIADFGAEVERLREAVQELERRIENLARRG